MCMLRQRQQIMIELLLDVAPCHCNLWKGISRSHLKLSQVGCPVKQCHWPSNVRRMIPSELLCLAGSEAESYRVQSQRRLVTGAFWWRNVAGKHRFAIRYVWYQIWPSLSKGYRAVQWFFCTANAGRKLLNRQRVYLTFYFWLSTHDKSISLIDIDMIWWLLINLHPRVSQSHLEGVFSTYIFQLPHHLAHAHVKLAPSLQPEWKPGICPGPVAHINHFCKPCHSIDRMSKLCLFLPNLFFPGSVSLKDHLLSEARKQSKTDSSQSLCLCLKRQYFKHRWWWVQFVCLLLGKKCS